MRQFSRVNKQVVNPYLKYHAVSCLDSLIKFLQSLNDEKVGTLHSCWELDLKVIYLIVNEESKLSKTCCKFDVQVCDAAVWGLAIFFVFHTRYGENIFCQNEVLDIEVLKY